MGRVTRSAVGGNLHPVSKQMEELLLTSMPYFFAIFFPINNVENDLIFLGLS